MRYNCPTVQRHWLNAASSITYPVAFNATERKVTVTGEVYLEIAHNAKQPFRLTVRNQTIEDIGTQFNVNAYEDEPAINTTLVEGSIRVSKGNTSTVLTPGQQASSKPDDSTFKISPVNTEEATAWKNGYFYFDHADIKTVMRELARWYDVQIIYKGEITKRTFKGKVYRNINASEALNILSFFGAHFSIEGRTITVSS
ncbi:FecR family protein [Puia sp. P3]|uniref:FecR family protein n=1 Tax=Puia sp. P3 TaxID=3423952 RepID=UPI003D67291B